MSSQDIVSRPQLGLGHLGLTQKKHITSVSNIYITHVLTETSVISTVDVKIKKKKLKQKGGKKNSGSDTICCTIYYIELCVAP